MLISLVNNILTPGQYVYTASAASSGASTLRSVNYGMNYTPSSASIPQVYTAVTSCNGLYVYMASETTTGSAVWKSANYGVSYTEIFISAVTQQYTALTCDSTGKYLACGNGVSGGNIMISNTYGTTFNTISSATAAWYNIYSDSTFTNLLATTLATGVHISTNSGLTWTAVSDIPVLNTQYFFGAISDSGQFMVVVNYADPQSNNPVYSSNNFGADGSWTASTSAPQNQWDSLAMDSTGQRLLGGYNSVSLYMGVNQTSAPTVVPTLSVSPTTVIPTATLEPTTITPTVTPTLIPTTLLVPSNEPSCAPTSPPTTNPTTETLPPTAMPSTVETQMPTADIPSPVPPQSYSPTFPPSAPTTVPQITPSIAPVATPSSTEPSQGPLPLSQIPTHETPTLSSRPTCAPSSTNSSSSPPTTAIPTLVPNYPSAQPTPPNDLPTTDPTVCMPSSSPSALSHLPTPSDPTVTPVSSTPTVTVSVRPTALPIIAPSAQPSTAAPTSLYALNWMISDAPSLD